MFFPLSLFVPSITVSHSFSAVLSFLRVPTTGPVKINGVVTPRLSSFSGLPSLSFSSCLQLPSVSFTAESKQLIRAPFSSSALLQARNGDIDPISSNNSKEEKTTHRDSTHRRDEHRLHKSQEEFEQVRRDTMRGISIQNPGDSWHMVKLEGSGDGEREKKSESRQQSNYLNPDWLKDLLRQGKIDQLFQTMETRAAIGSFPETGIYLPLVRYIRSNGDIVGASMILDFSDRYRIELDFVILNIILDAFAKKNFQEGMDRIFQIYQRRGLKLDQFSYASLIYQKSRMGDIDAALLLLDNMKKEGIPRNLVCYTELMYGCAKSPQYLEQSFTLFRQMIDEDKIQPDNGAWAAYLTALLIKLPLQESLNAIKSLESKGFRPSMTHFLTIMTKMAQNGQFDDFPVVLLSLESHRLYPSIMIITKIMSIIIDHGGLFSHSQKIFDMLPKLGIVPDATLFGILIKSLANAADNQTKGESLRNLDSIIQQMVALSLPFGEMHLRHVADLHLRLGATAEECLALVLDDKWVQLTSPFSTSNNSPITSMMYHILKQFSDQQNVEATKFLFNSLTPIKTIRGYGILLSAYCNSDNFLTRFDEVISILQRVKSLGSGPPTAAIGCFADLSVHLTPVQKARFHDTVGSFKHRFNSNSNSNSNNTKNPQHRLPFKTPPK